MTDMQWDMWIRGTRFATCPVCGTKYRVGYENPRHKCADNVLSAIDGAYRRDPDTEEPLNSTGNYKYRTYGQRLEEGFNMLRMADDDVADSFDNDYSGAYLDNPYDEL